MTIAADRVKQLVLRNGTVFDGIHEPVVADVAIQDGRILAVGTSLDLDFASELDCTDRYVVPGLVDLHIHGFHRVMPLSVEVDRASLYRGVVAVAEAGSAGALTFEALRHDIVAKAASRMVVWLNVGRAGALAGFVSELQDRAAFDEDAAFGALDAHRDVIRGFKLRLGLRITGGDELEILDRGVALAKRAGVPLMVHHGEEGVPLAEILPRMGSGDVLTHCYAGREGGILSGGEVVDAAHDARSRGVRFDVGAGRYHWSFDVAEAAIAQGFPPDTISSDLVRPGWEQLGHDLIRHVSALRRAGMSTPDVIRAASTVPAGILRLHDEGYGALRPGEPAHVTVLEEAESVPMHDGLGEVRDVARLEPVFVIHDGVVHPVMKWSGEWSPSKPFVPHTATFTGWWT